LFNKLNIEGENNFNYGNWIYSDLCNQCLSPTKVVISNPAHGKVYSMQHYVIKFVSELRSVGGFSPASSINKTKIFLKVALNTMTNQ